MYEVAKNVDQSFMATELLDGVTLKHRQVG